MLTIFQTAETEYQEVRSFYHTLIDMMKGAEYRPAWEKGVYPSDEYLLDSVRGGTLYTGRLDGEIVSAMIVNRKNNEGYRQVKWGVEAEDHEVTVIHALGMLPACAGRGFAKAMVRKAIALAERDGQKAVRLDVLSGNLPAERLYAGMGFRYMGTVRMFYEDTGWTDFLLYEYPLRNVKK